KPAGDPRAAAGDGRPVGPPPRRAGADRRPRGRCRGRDLGPAAAAQGSRRLVDPRRPGREARPGADDPPDTVAKIVADVGDRGDVALAQGSEQLGDGTPGRVEPGGALDAEALAAVRALVAAVELVHAAQRPTDTTVTPLPGVEITRRWLPVDSVGIY